MSGLLFAAWLAAGQTVGPVAPPDVQVQTVTLSWDAKAHSCGAQVNSAEIADLGEEAGRAALLRALPDKSRIVRLGGTGETPYACVGDVVALLRREGYRLTIGFSAAPVRR